MNLKLAFFDIDGTLIRRSRKGIKSLKTRSINYAMETVFGIAGIDYMSILGKRIYGMTDILIVKSALLESGVSEKQFYARLHELFEAIDRYFDLHAGDWNNGDYVKLPHISEFLENLRTWGVRLGLVTGNIKKHSDWKMRNAGFDGYFATGAYGNDAEERWQILQIALERNVDIPAGLACHFGDSPPDLDAARRCGIRAVAVSDRGGGTHTKPELEKVGYGLVIDGWDEIETIEEYLR